MISWWLDLVPNIGNTMAWCLLKLNGEVVVRTTLRSLTDEENNSTQEQERSIFYDTSLKLILGDSITDEDLPQSITPTYKPYKNEDGEVESPIVEVYDIYDYDKYIES